MAHAAAARRGTNSEGTPASLALTALILEEEMAYVSSALDAQHVMLKTECALHAKQDTAYLSAYASPAELELTLQEELESV